jgi:hypothetical protein
MMIEAVRREMKATATMAYQDPWDTPFVIRLIGIFFDNLPVDVMATALDPSVWENDDAGLWRSAISVARRKKSTRQIRAAISAARGQVLGSAKGDA